MKRIFLPLLALSMIAIAAEPCKSCKPCQRKECKKPCDKCKKPVCSCKKEEVRKPCCVKLEEKKVQPERTCDYVCPAGSVEKK